MPVEIDDPDIVKEAGQELPNSGDWITAEGVKVPSVLELPVAAIKRFVHGATGSLDEKAAAGIDTLLGIGKGDYTDFKGRYMQNEKRNLGNAELDKEKSGLIGTGAEIAGAVMSPLNKVIPGIGVTKPGIARNAIKFGLTGAGTGAAFAGLSHLGETASDQISPESLGEAMKTGGEWGGALGALGGGVLGHLAKRTPELQLKAIAATKSDITQPGKVVGATNKTAEVNKALELADEAERMGLTGGFGQRMKTTHAEATKLSNAVGKDGERLRDAIYQEAQNKGASSFAFASDVRKDIATAVLDRLGQNKAVLPDHAEALSNMLGSELSTLGKRHDPVSIREVYRTWRAINEKNKGLRGDKAWKDSPTGEVALYVENALKDIFRAEAKKVSPKLASKLQDADHAYHISQSVENMTASGLAGELGQRPGGGLLGTVRGMALSSLGRFGLPGKTAAYTVGNLMSQRGVIPNTLLNILRHPQRVPMGARLAGSKLGQPSPESIE